MGCGVVEFATKEETHRALDEFKSQPFTYHTIYIRHLPLMAFPGPVGGCTSWKLMKAQHKEQKRIRKEQRKEKEQQPEETPREPKKKERNARIKVNK